MKNEIFCPQCSEEISLNTIACNCGYEMTGIEKKRIQNRLIELNGTQIINKNISEYAIDSFNCIGNYKLSNTYFRSSSAIRDYEAKADFLKSNVIPSINEFTSQIERADHQVSIDKLEIMGKICNITDFILKEFFGPFTIKENKLEEFVDARDYSKNKLRETMINAHIDLSEIKNVELGAISKNVSSAAYKALSQGSFQHISKKSEWTKSEVNLVKAEVGLAVATELFVGISSKITQNNDSIAKVREADSELNDKIENISNVINNLVVEQSELQKKKFLLDKCDLILDTCYENLLKDIVNELYSNEIYKNYKKEREPYDYQQRKIEMDNQLLDEKVKVSFWLCLMGTKTTNFRIYWNKRLKMTDTKNSYLKVCDFLNEKKHYSLKALNVYHKTHLEKFMIFEKDNRRVLKQLPVIANNHRDVIKFAKVLKNIKTNI